MELSQLETRPLHDKGAEMRVLGPDGKETDFYITVAGIDSLLWEQMKRDMDRATILGDEYGVNKALAGVTLGWRGLTKNKKDVEFNQENAESLYKNAPYIRDQVDIFVAKRANFVKPSQKK